jgi:hypothetical protein
LIAEDEAIGKQRIINSGTLVGPLAATATFVILGLVSLGFYVSLGGLLIGAAALVDSRVGRNAGIVAGFIVALFIVYLVILPALGGPIPPGVSRGGPGVLPPR